MAGTIDLRNMKKEDVDEEKKKTPILEYEHDFMIQTVQAAKAPKDEDDKENTKDIFEVTLVTYMEAPMVSNLFGKAHGHFVKMRF